MPRYPARTTVSRSQGEARARAHWESWASARGSIRYSLGRSHQIRYPAKIRRGNPSQDRIKSRPSCHARGIRISADFPSKGPACAGTAPSNQIPFFESFGQAQAGSQEAICVAAAWAGGRGVVQTNSNTPPPTPWESVWSSGSGKTSGAVLTAEGPDPRTREACGPHTAYGCAAFTQVRT